MNLETEFLNRVELLFSSIGIILGLFFCLLLLTKKSKNLKTNFFLSLYLLAFSLRTGKALFHNYYALNDTIITLFLGLFLLIGPSLWFYSKCLNKEGDSLKRSDYFLHFSPFFLVELLCLFFLNNGVTNLRIFYFSFFVHGLVYCFYILFWLLKISKTQKNKEIYTWIIALICATILMCINAILIHFDVVSFYPSSTFLFSFIIIVLIIIGSRNLWLFEEEKEKYFNSTLDIQKANEHFNLLNQLMDKDKLFLDPELTLIKLAERVSVSPKQLSQIINQIENTNYSQYIAKYRVEEAMKYLSDPKYSQYKIAAIAYDSGFNSISSFNVAFKKIANCTAIDYRESNIKN
jgi:AraC-like DNA-binding protein